MQLFSGDRGVFRPRVSRVFSEGPELSRSDFTFGPVLLAGEKKVSLVRRKKRLCHIDQVMSNLDFVLLAAILTWLIKVFDSEDLILPSFLSLNRCSGFIGHIMSLLRTCDGIPFEQLGAHDWD